MQVCPILDKPQALILVDTKDNMTNQESNKKIKFDATINLGHILTFIGFMVSGFLTYENIDKRILTLESGQRVQDVRDNSQDHEQQMLYSNIKESLVDIKRAVSRIEDKQK